MITWLAIILLISIGLGLVIAEIIFIPGVTVVGLLGIVFMVAGVVISFMSFGVSTGLIVLGISLMAGLMTIYISFKAGVWKRFSLKTSIESRFNEGLTHDLREGQTGISISALRPMGKAEFSGKTYEVSTLGQYLKQGEHLKIIKIKDNKIIVENIK